MSTSTALVIDSHSVRRDGEMWCLTDLWRAGSAHEELKRRNPYPRDVSLHQQWLQEQRYELARRDMTRVLDTARESTKWTEFEIALRAKFRRAPLQLRLVR